MRKSSKRSMVHLPRIIGGARISGAVSPFAAIAVLLLFFAVLLASLREKSAGFDEPGHATAGSVYWRTNDYRIDPENGNLSKRWIALPFLFSGEKFPAGNAVGWRQANTWRLADEWFNRLGNDTTAMLARGRAMSALVAVALGLVVWGWSRQLFGPTGAMFSLLLYVLNPAILANGALMTSDTPAALGFLLSLWCIAMTLERICTARVMAATLAIAGLFLAKMSAVLLLPMAALLVAARLLRPELLPIGSRSSLVRRSHQAATLAGVAAVVTLGVVAIVWAFYGFRYSAFAEKGPAPHCFNRPWEWALEVPPPLKLIDQLGVTDAQKKQCDAIFHGEFTVADWSYATLEDLEQVRRNVLTPTQTAALDALLQAPPPRWVPRLIHFARQHRLLPEAFLYGYAHVWKTSDKLAAFFNGEIRETGWRTFFPFTFAVKTPLAFLATVAIALGTAGMLWKKRARPAWNLIYPVLPLCVLLVVYWSVAIASHLNIGHRHLLPVYPPLFVLCGAAGLWLSNSSKLDVFALVTRARVRVALVTLTLVLALETAWRFPNYLAYFNGLVRPARAYRHLIDSSLDWGQELPAIARYLRSHANEPAYLAYFGVGRPAYYGINAHHLGGFPAVDWKLFPPFVPLIGKSNAAILTFLREHPEFDPDLIFRIEDRNATGVALTHRSSAHRLGAGHYVISASMLQPIYCGNVDGFWNASLEQAYQQLRRAVQPFLSDDREAKIRAMPTRSIPEWVSLFDDYYNFRLARLATFLRTREPDDMINFSVLVYRLTEADLARALDGPSP
jgi:hypothetical protein